MKGNFGTGHLCNSGSAEINYLGMCAEITSLSCNVPVKEL